MSLKIKKNIDLQILKSIQNQNQYFLDLLAINLTCFKYYNLPKSIDTRFLELTLILRGRAVLYYDDILGQYLGLQLDTTGQRNQYGYPTRYRALGANGYRSDILTPENSVIIYNNEMMVSDLFRINYTADLLAEFDKTIEINLNGLKTPLLYQGTKRQLESLKALHNQYISGTTPIFCDDSVDVCGNAIKTIDLKPTYYIDKLQDAKANIWNDTLTAMGITNMSFFKRERQTDDEVRRLSGGAYANRNKRLKPREDAIAKFNQIFGLNARVDFNENQDEKLNPDSESEVNNNNEQVYDRT